MPRLLAGHSLCAFCLTLSYINIANNAVSTASIPLSSTESLRRGLRFMRFAVPTTALFGSNPCTDIFSSPVLSTLCAYEISIPFSCTFVKSNRELEITYFLYARAPKRPVTDHLPVLQHPSVQPHQPRPRYQSRYPLRTLRRYGHPHQR